MARYAKIFNNFTGGEIAPDVLGRTDLAQYQNGCELLQNFLPTTTGGVRRRPGTIVGKSHDTWTDVETTSQDVRLIPYVFSKEFSYVIAIYGFSGIGIKIYKTEENSLRGGNTGATVTDNSTFSGYSSAHVDTIKMTSSGNEIFLAHPNYKPLKIIRTTENAFSIYDYDDDNLFDSVKEKIKVIPFQDINTTSITVTPSATTGAITLTSSDVINWGDYIRFDSGGSSGVALITSTPSGTSASATILTGFNLASTSAQTAWTMSAWGQLWPVHPVSLGYPRAITLYQQRLVYAGNATFPDSIWFSETANKARFLRAKLDQWATTELQSGNAAAIQVTLSSQDVNQILWLLDAGGGDLGIGTAGDEWVGFAPDSGSGFGPTNLRFNQQSSYGSADVQPVMADGVLVFVQRDGRVLRTLQFNETAGKYISNDLTALAPHLIRDTYDDRETLWDYRPESGQNETSIFKAIAYDTTFGCIWVLTNFGDVFTCAFSREFEVSAWSRQVLGGRYEFSVRDDPAQEQSPRVRSLCVVPGRIDDVTGRFRDFIYMGVTRLLNERVGTLIEFIAPFAERNSLDSSVDVSGANQNISHFTHVFLDCAFGAMASGSDATNSFDIGEVLGSVFQDEWRNVEVSVVADGKVIDDVTIDGSDILDTTDDYTSYVAGFRYTHKLKTTKPDEGSRIGTAAGMINRIHTVITRLYRTAQLKIGDPSDTTKMEELIFDREGGVSTNVIELYTGDKKIDHPGTFDEEPYVYIEGDEPLPLNISGIIIVGEVSEY